ncbi:MAG TPA: hypothetical protein VIQ97_00650, partial [Prevotella sp.]
LGDCQLSTLNHQLSICPYNSLTKKLKNLSTQRTARPLQHCCRGWAAVLQSLDSNVAKAQQ